MRNPASALREAGLVGERDARLEERLPGSCGSRLRSTMTCWVAGELPETYPFGV